jgi:hypothetical protein
MIAKEKTPAGGSWGRLLKACRPGALIGTPSVTASKWGRSYFAKSTYTLEALGGGGMAGLVQSELAKKKPLEAASFKFVLDTLIALVNDGLLTRPSPSTTAGRTSLPDDWVTRNGNRCADRQTAVTGMRPRRSKRNNQSPLWISGSQSQGGVTRNWEHGAFSVGTVEKHECISVKELQVDIAKNFQ